MSVLTRLMHRPALRAVGVLAGATGLGQLAILASLPLLTRLYDPAAFGLFGLLTGFVGVATVGACLCLDIAIVGSSTDQAADELFVAAVISAALVSAMSGLAMGVMILNHWIGFGQLSFWSVPLISIMVLSNGLYLASRYRTLRDNHFEHIARASLKQSLGRAIAPVLWSALAPGWGGLALGELTGRGIGVGGLMRPLLPKLAVLRMKVGWVSAWWAIVRRERRYTAAMLPLALIDAAASLMIAPLFAARYGAKEAGEYFLVAMILVAPSALIGTAVADVIHTRGAALRLNAPSELPRFTRKVALALLAAGCAIYLPVLMLAPLVFPFVLGNSWDLAAHIAQAMTPFMIVAFVASPISRLLAAVNKPHLKVWSDVLRVLGVPLLIDTCARHAVPFMDAMMYLSWFLAVAYFIYFLVVYYAIHLDLKSP
ncbi:MAG: oligosaccharide flippase family protein [Ramlibacter sp.]|nr:oligosaccharide flippase family protein [Ramlibacter sp.]